MNIRKIGGLWFLSMGRYTFMFCRSRVTRQPSWFPNWVKEHERLHEVMASRERRTVRTHAPVIDHE